MPCIIDRETYEQLLDPNSEGKVTLVASPISIETPVDGEGEDGVPIIKLKVVHVGSVRVTGHK